MSDREIPADDVDPGEPVAEIVALREEPTHGFLARIRDGILGRLAGSQMLDFAVSGLLDFMKEFGEFLFGFLGQAQDGDTDGRGSAGGAGNETNGGGNRE